MTDASCAVLSSADLAALLPQLALYLAGWVLLGQFVVQALAALARWALEPLSAAPKSAADYYREDESASRF